jgi:hypothetical protein
MDPEHWSLPLNETEEIISLTIVTFRPLSHYTAFHGVQSLYKHQRKMEKWRGAEREEAGGGDIFLMREPKENRSYICEEDSPKIYAS